MGGCTYSLVARSNFYYGPNGLPAITNDITIDGTSQARSSSVPRRVPPTFRLFSFAGAGLPPEKSRTAGAAKPDAGGGVAHKAEAAARQW